MGLSISEILLLLQVIVLLIALLFLLIIHCASSTLEDEQTLEHPKTTQNSKFLKEKLTLFHEIFLKGKDNCPICLLCLNQKQKVVRLPICNHVFHEKCIVDWVEKKPNCPCCRSDVNKNIHKYWEEYKKANGIKKCSNPESSSIFNEKDPSSVSDSIVSV